MNTICIDQGASSTRFVVNDDDVNIYPNNAVFIDESVETYIVPSSDNIVDNLDLTIHKTEGESSYFPVRALLGDMAMRYKSVNIRPSMNSNKGRQKVNYVSIITAVATSYLEEKLSGDVTLIIDFPPVEVNNATLEYVKKQLIGTYEVTFNTINVNKTVTFRVQDVRVASEGATASAAFFFKPDATPRAEFAKYNKGYVLIMDIGDSTTDLALIHDRADVNIARQTYKVGGRVIKGMVRDAIRVKYGSEITEDSVNEIITSGRMPYGNDYKDVTSELEEAKRSFVDLIYDKMDDYFRRVGVDLTDIKGIFTCGGGAMQSVYFDEEKNEAVVVSESVAKYLAEKLKDICDGVDVVEYPGDNPRLANIIGTVIITKGLRK